MPIAKPASFRMMKAAGEAGTLIITRDDERGGIDTQSIADLIRDVLTE